MTETCWCPRGSAGRRRPATAAGRPARWPSSCTATPPTTPPRGRPSPSRCAGRRRSTPPCRRPSATASRSRPTTHGTVAEATSSQAPLAEVDSVAVEVARAAEASYAGLVQHPFPSCFTCGPDRAEGDGLRIFPGPVDKVDGGLLVAASWTPHPSTSEDWHAYDDDHRRASLPVTWAALDCPGGWAGELGTYPAVLGRMTARVDTLPVIGEEHVLVGHARGREGRKIHTACTLYDSDGRVVASAEHVWITVDPTTFR